MLAFSQILNSREIVEGLEIVNAYLLINILYILYGLVLYQGSVS